MFFWSCFIRKSDEKKIKDGNNEERNMKFYCFIVIEVE